MSESIGELLQNGPVAKETKRSSYRLDQRVATNNKRHRCEDAETFHGRRFSSWEESNSVPTLGGERSSCSNEKLAGHRNPIEHSRLAQMDELAGAVEHLTRSRVKDVPEETAFHTKALDMLKEIRKLLMTAGLSCCSHCHAERDAPTHLSLIHI